jgi:phytoene dehydrogenase-like protein
MLESRNRIGGRIVSSEFDGIKVELGASYVHCPNYKNNLINKYTK